MLSNVFYIPGLALIILRSAMLGYKIKQRETKLGDYSYAKYKLDKGKTKEENSKQN